jgi:hypothetical protein
MFSFFPCDQCGFPRYFRRIEIEKKSTIHEKIRHGIKKMMLAIYIYFR